MHETSNTANRIVGGVDTHKDLHVAAVVGVSETLCI